MIGGQGRGSSWAVLDDYYGCLLGIPAAQAIRMCVPHLCWSIIKGKWWGETNVLGLGEEWKSAGGLPAGAEGLRATPLLRQHVALAKILVNVPSHLWALGAL